MINSSSKYFIQQRNSSVMWDNTRAFLPEQWKYMRLFSAWGEPVCDGVDPYPSVPLKTIWRGGSLSEWWVYENSLMGQYVIKLESTLNGDACTSCPRHIERIYLFSCKALNPYCGPDWVIFLRNLNPLYKYTYKKAFWRKNNSIPPLYLRSFLIISPRKFESGHTRIFGSELCRK